MKWREWILWISSARPWSRGIAEFVQFDGASSSLQDIGARQSRLDLLGSVVHDDFCCWSPRARQPCTEGCHQNTAPRQEAHCVAMGASPFPYRGVRNSLEHVSSFATKSRGVAYTGYNIICVYIYIYTYIYTHTYIYIDIDTYTYIYIYVYILYVCREP